MSAHQTSLFQIQIGFSEGGDSNTIRIVGQAIRHTGSQVWGVGGLGGAVSDTESRV